MPQLSQVPSGMCSHVFLLHLGHCLGCPRRLSAAFLARLLIPGFGASSSSLSSLSAFSFFFCRFPFPCIQQPASSQLLFNATCKPQRSQRLFHNGCHGLVPHEGHVYGPGPRGGEADRIMPFAFASASSLSISTFSCLIFTASASCFSSSQALVSTSAGGSAGTAAALV